MKRRKRVATAFSSLEREDWVALAVCAVVFVGAAAMVVLLLGIHPYK